MKNFIMFLINTPKASILGLGVAIAQILKYTGVITAFNQEELNKVLDAISLILGFIGLYFAGKGQWPASSTEPPK